MLYKLKLGEMVTTIPTIGFNVETLDYPDGGKITLWDVGGERFASCGGLETSS